MTFLSHLESTADGSRLPADQLQTVHLNRPLLARYDLDAVRTAVARGDLARRPPTLWRYRELLPLRNPGAAISLGENFTPLLACPRLGAAIGSRNLWIKDESLLPTGSFKARGMAVALSRAVELGVRRVAVPTQGNAGGALAAYAARAGIECYVFMPEDIPVVNKLEATAYGARAFVAGGQIHDCGAIVKAGIDRMGWFDFSTLREPYRIEGKKTMGLELAEQCGWELPDVILYPTGGGTGLIGMWKAFAELAELGWLDRDSRPRMFSCQSAGCAPIALAYDRGDQHGVEVASPATIASGLRVPKPLGDFLVLDAVRASGGRAVAVDEDRIPGLMSLAASLEGIPLCPEAATCIGALADAIAHGDIAADDRVVVFNTGAMQKYVEALNVELPRLDVSDIAWDEIAAPPAP